MLLKLSCLISVLLLNTEIFAQAAQPGTGSAMTSFVPMIIVMFIVFYFFMIRPEQKKQKQKQQMMGNLKKGDKVVTIGGIYGTIQGVRDDTFMIKISDNSTVKFAKSSIANVITEKEVKESITKETKETKGESDDDSQDESKEKKS